MFKATALVLSKASRRTLTPKRGNKDFYKGGFIGSRVIVEQRMTPFVFAGTRQAYLPGGLRTGAPGKHVVSGKAKYRLVDEQVRYFVAPSIEDLNNTPVSLRVKQVNWSCLLTNFHVFPQLKPYVYSKVKLTKDQKNEIYGKLPQGGLTPEHYLEIAPRFGSESSQPTSQASST